MNDVNPANLGEKLAEVHPGRTFFAAVLGIGVLLCSCGIITFVTNYGQAQGGADTVVAIVLLVLGLLGLGIGLRKVGRNRASLTAYENGLVERRRGKVLTILWQDVTHIWRNEIQIEQNKTRGFGTQERTLTTWRIRNERGTEVSLESFAAVAVVAEEKVWPRLWEQVMGQIDRGETAVFDPIHINQESISFEDSTYRWEEIVAIKFERTVKLQFPNDRKKNWKKARTLSIPNLPLLKQFIEGKIGAAPSEPAKEQE